MKRRLKYSIKSLILLASLSYAGLANAHTFFGGVIAFKTTQVYQIVCEAPSTSLEVRVNDISANDGIMSVTVFKGGTADTASDLLQGDGGLPGVGYSEFASVTAGAGEYTIIATQTADVFGQYFLDYHCRDTIGNETTADPTLAGTAPTDLRLTQN